VENLSQKVAGLDAEARAEDTKDTSPVEVLDEEANDTNGADKVATAAAATATRAAPKIKVGKTWLYYMVKMHSKETNLVRISFQTEN